MSKLNGKSAAHDLDCDVAVLGAGPGGYSAAFRAADLGQDTVLIERWPVLGGVCLNVGCIPSKALLHTAAAIEHAASLTGVSFGTPAIDLDKLRAHKVDVVSRLTTGLSGMAKSRKVRVTRGSAAFVSPNEIEVVDGDTRTSVRFKSAIIAAGSEAVKLPFAPVDARIIDSSGALELNDVPERLLVIGGGIIGLEMSTIYSTLGSSVDCVEMLDGLMPGADRDLVKVWQASNETRFNKIMLSTRVTSLVAEPDGIYASFSGQDAADVRMRYDKVLVAVGRTPNGRNIGADLAGVELTEQGFVKVDDHRRTSVSHIYAIGDIAGGPMLAHKAVHEGHVAAENASGKMSYFDAVQIPSVAYTAPEVAWAGLTEDQAKASGRRVAKAVFPWSASGRAIANGCDQGITKLLFDPDTRRCLGGGIVGANAGDLIGEICLAIEMGADAEDMGKTIHPHPTLVEGIGMAAELAEGKCTDLPARKSAFPAKLAEQEDRV